MERLNRGFGLIELMIAIVLATIVMIGVYKYFTKNVKEMSDTVKLSVLKGNAQLIFNNLAVDLKLIGYNPRDLVDANNNLLFGIRRDLIPQHLENPNHLSPYDSLRYSFFNTDSGCTPVCNPICNNNPMKNDADCCCSRYFVDNDDTLKREYYDISTHTRQEMTLMSNVCARFLFWNNATDTQCVCQNGIKCADTDGDGTCSARDVNRPPTTIKFILAVAPDEESAAAIFIPANSLCQIPQPDPGEQQKFVRFEKKIYLTNLVR